MRASGFRGWFTASLLLVAVAGCASSGGGTRTDLDRLTESEIESVDVSTLFDVVQRLRPRWLDVRATSFEGSTDIVVFQGQAYLGGVEVLRTLSPDAARWMEYLDGPQASATLPGMGSRRVEGAIVIHTTPPRD